MSGYSFSLVPQEVPLVQTKYRAIRAKVPPPESIPLFQDLEKYESRSMHGQLPVIWSRATEGLDVLEESIAEIDSEETK